MTIFDRLTLGQRIDKVKEMDDNIMNTIDDENLLDIWLTYGCPDESTPSDYLSFATDEQAFLELIELYESLIGEAS